MKILYLSCHAILEYDEVSILSELGHEVHSHGVYRDPRGAYTLPRPGVPTMQLDERFLELSAHHPKTDLVPEMYEWADLIIIMSGEQEAPLINNWERIKHKRVILRMIGQSTPANERLLQKYRDEGLEIIRYSPKEANLPNYAGGDTIIRFAKDPEEFKDWNGNDNRPVNFTQSLKNRNQATHYDEVLGSLAGFEGAKVYGPGNDDIGSFNGGEMPYEELKRIMRDARCLVYTGTWPANYTLSFIEAMMTGIPMVAASKTIAHVPNYEQFDFYECDEILLEAGIKSHDNVFSMRETIQSYLADHELAKQVSQRQREVAIKLFGKDTIKEQWRLFLERQDARET